MIPVRRGQHNAKPIIHRTANPRGHLNRVRLGWRMVHLCGVAMSRLVIMSGRLATDFGAGLTVGLLAGTAVGATLAAFLFFLGAN